MNTQARTRIGNCWLWVLNRHQEAMKTQMLKKKIEKKNVRGTVPSSCHVSANKNEK